MNFQVLGLSVKLAATPTPNWWHQATHESFLREFRTCRSSGGVLGPSETTLHEERLKI